MKRLLKKHGVSLYQGDGLHFLNAMKEPVDLVLTDPPYDQVKDVANELLAWQKTRKHTSTVVLFHSPLQIPEDADERLFWVKTPSTKNFSRRCGRFVEMIAVYRRGGAFNLLHWSQMIGVYDDKLVHPPLYPHQKPLSLIERLIRIYSSPNGLVVDPFVGTGTTLLAAINTGRRAIGIEKDRKQCAVAVKRLAAGPSSTFSRGKKLT